MNLFHAYAQESSEYWNLVNSKFQPLSFAKHLSQELIQLPIAEVEKLREKNALPARPPGRPRKHPAKDPTKVGEPV